MFFDFLEYFELVAEWDLHYLQMFIIQLKNRLEILNPIFNEYMSVLVFQFHRVQEIIEFFEIYSSPHTSYFLQIPAARGLSASFKQPCLDLKPLILGIS